MKKINLKPYKAEPEPESLAIEKIISTPGVLALLQKSPSWLPEEINVLRMGIVGSTYEVKDSIKRLLLDQRGIDGTEFYNRFDLVDKIIRAGNSIILQDSEYQKVEQALRSHTTWNTRDVEFSKRIFEAKEVKKIKEDK